MSKIKSGMKELFTIASKGLKGEKITVPVEVSEKRYAICEGCPHLTRFKTCEICLCSMKLKTKCKDSECPIGKWSKWENNEALTEN